MEITPEQAQEYAKYKNEIGEKLISIKEDIADLERKTTEHNLSVMAQIADEVDGAGKPLFSNAEKRSAELNRRLSADASYQDDVLTLRKLKRQAQVEQGEFNYMSDLLAICLAFAWK